MAIFNILNVKKSLQIEKKKANYPVEKVGKSKKNELVLQNEEMPKN